jgi:hypothetical protein
MHTGIVVVDIEVFFSLWSQRPDGIEKSRELSVSDLGPIDRKLREIDAMLGPLVLGTVVAAHQKPSRRDSYRRVGFFSGTGVTQARASEKKAESWQTAPYGTVEQDHE